MWPTKPISDAVLLYTNNSSDYFTENGTYLNTSDGTASETLSHPNILLPYSVLLTIAIYLTVVGILSTFGNLLFILTVIRWRYLRNNSHMLLLLNMAAADLAISLTGYPYTTISGYIGKWVFGSVMCQLYAFLCFTFAQVSMNTLVAVSVFRYIAICHPHLKHLLTSRNSVLALGIVWCHALFWTLTPLIGWSSYTFEPTGISCSFDWNDRTVGGISYVLGTTLFCYLFHIIVLVWCYRRIFQTVYHLRRKKTKLRDLGFRRAGRSETTTTLDSRLSLSNVGKQPNLEQDVDEDDPPDSPVISPGCQSLVIFSFATENFTEMELHVLGMNIAMVVSFIIFWTPYAILSCISAFYDKLSPFWYIFPTIFAKTSCMINPILYGLTNSFLRKQLLLVLRGFLGLTTAIEDFEVMRQRQQDGLYNKEGIFVGKRTGAITHCPCDGCVVSSRRQIKLLVKQHQNVVVAAINNSSPAVVSTKQIEMPEIRIPPLSVQDQKVTSDLGKGENSTGKYSDGVLHSDYNNGPGDEDDVDSDGKSSLQRLSIPLSITTSNELQSSNVVKEDGGGHCNTNTIILSSKDGATDSKKKEIRVTSKVEISES